jgi:hypothetical protein
MTKRKTSSPYKRPPDEDVRELMRVGWRRIDAERLVLVRTCVNAAKMLPGRPELVPIAAVAAAALEHEPTLAAAALHIAPTRGSVEALYRLVSFAPRGRRSGLIQLWDLAGAYALHDPEDDTYDELPA